MKPIRIVALTVALAAAPIVARADVCDFRPSILAGKGGAAVKDTAVSGVRALGTYTLNNPVSVSGKETPWVKGSPFVG